MSIGQIIDLNILIFHVRVTLLDFMILFKLYIHLFTACILPFISSVILLSASRYFNNSIFSKLCVSIVTFCPNLSCVFCLFKHIYLVFFPHSPLVQISLLLSSFCWTFLLRWCLAMMFSVGVIPICWQKLWFISQEFGFNLCCSYYLSSGLY